MIIYAIVNGLLTDRNIATDETFWTLLSPSAIVQGGNPYFVPDFDTRFSVHLALALKIGKLGKGIAPRFAHRYVESVTPAALFVATNLLAGLSQSGLPWTAAVSYDRSLALGSFTKMSYYDLDGIKFGLELRSDTGATELSSEICVSLIEETIVRISRDNTLKTGDMIILAISPGGEVVNPGMKAHFSIGSRDAGSFNIR